MTSLYEISEKYLNLIEMMDCQDNEESMQEAIKTTLDVIEDDIQSKAGNIAHILRNYNDDIENIKKEIDRLRGKLKSVVNHKENLKLYLKDNMSKCGINKITTPLFSISIKNSKRAVVISDIDLLSDDYKNCKTDITADKNKIYDAIIKGYTIPGAFLDVENKSIVIK